jgi:hypothetical protein
MLRFMLLADAIPPAEGTLFGGVVSLLVVLITALVKHFAKERAKERLRTVDNIIRIVYGATAEAAELAKKGKAGPILDKIAYALQLFDEQFEAEGLSPPTAYERSRAQLEWKGLHGSQLFTERVTAAAAVPQ